MGIVGGPHDVVLSDARDHFHAEGLILEGAPDIAMKLLAGPQLGEVSQVLTVVLMLEVEALECKGDPADRRFTQHELELRVSLEHLSLIHI